MTENLRIAQLYFDLSNRSDFSGIEALLTETTTYSSQNTGIFLGNKDIIAMQQEFHAKFASLAWRVELVDEVRPGIVLFEYNFEGHLKGGDVIRSAGLEYVIVFKAKIQHIEIRNKE